ncbi:MAG: hypothetical protein WDN24_08765 [Sphingomonas sp.]
MRVESRFDQLETDFEQYTLSLHQDLGGSLRFDGLGGISKSKFANPIQTTVTLDANNVTGYTYDFTSGRNPAFGYGNLDGNQSEQLHPFRDPHPPAGREQRFQGAARPVRS